MMPPPAPMLPPPPVVVAVVKVDEAMAMTAVESVAAAPNDAPLPLPMHPFDDLKTAVV